LQQLFYLSRYRRRCQSRAGMYDLAYSIYTGQVLFIVVER
jgi:hypothetical protein